MIQTVHWSAATGACGVIRFVCSQTFLGKKITAWLVSYVSHYYVFLTFNRIV